jgi:hypothetical protein
MSIGKMVFDRRLTAVAFCYFLACSVLLCVFGIQLGGEADKFIENAERIINGQEFFNGVFGYFYVVYSLLVALFIKLSVNLVLVAVSQITLSFIAALCLYKLLKQTLGNSNIAFLFFIAYLLCYPVQKWNFFLYSESVHTSLVVIGIYLFNAWLTEKKVKLFLYFTIVFLLILFSRPVGLLFLFSMFTVLMFWLYQNKKRVQFYILAGISIVSLILILNSLFTAFINPDSIRRMEIICQVPGSNIESPYKEYNREGLRKAFSVIKDEIGIGNFFKAGLKKTGCFFGMYRNYYSWQNNLLLICFTIFYPFALIGLFSKGNRGFCYIRLFAATYLLFTTIGIFFTCDEWSNRFISPAFPFILILAAVGFFSIRKRFVKSDNQKA